MREKDIVTLSCHHLAHSGQQWPASEDWWWTLRTHGCSLWRGGWPARGTRPPLHPGRPRFATSWTCSSHSLRGRQSFWLVTACHALLQLVCGCFCVHFCAIKKSGRRQHVVWNERQTKVLLVTYRTWPRRIRLHNPVFRRILGSLCLCISRFCIGMWDRCMLYHWL